VTSNTAAPKGEPIPDFLKLPAPLAQHPIVAELGLPMMPEDELARLGEDIKVKLHDPITLYENKIPDGWNRYNAGRKAGYQFRPEDFVQLHDGLDPLAFVISKNIHRRHLTQEKKREVIAVYVKLFPDRSSRWIASDLGVSHNTVQSVRAETATEPRWSN
jgi:hypothetical protein